MVNFGKYNFKIVSITTKDSIIRDVTRVINISLNIVISNLKKQK